ncbi:MAG: hypothetical protein ACHQX1_00575 [Candidatus Micrarchaeales archaeon]
MFVIYFIFQRSSSFAIIFGAAIFFLIIIILVLEISNGFKEEGAKKNITEILAAVIIVVVFWYALRFVLNTNYPLDVVPSCSMLPVLHRGDMILLQGANQNNLIAPIVNVTSSQFSSSFSSTGTEALQCVAYSANNGNVRVSQIVSPGDNVGLLLVSSTGSEIVQNSYQNNSLVKYTCGIVNVTYQNGTVEKEASTTAITIGNTTITGDKNNSVIVYATVPQDQFYREGDGYIVHRVYALINASGTYYALTKGDNNPGLDVQYMNTPANLSQIGGKVIGSVPFLGYIKLILSNNFVEPTGCNYTTTSQ